MKYVRLSGCGLTVSKVCLGTMTFGGQLSKTDSTTVVKIAKQEGINFIDTADIYTAGESEKHVGCALKGDRHDWILATKVCNRTGSGHNDEGLSRLHIMNAIESSLRNLQTDYIDIYYLHRPDYGTPIDETMEAMHRLLVDGKIRYIGVSNFSSWSIVDILHLCKERLISAPVINQTVYNLLTRGIEDELMPMSKQFGISTIVYNPLASGLLTGKHQRHAPVSGSRLSTSELYKNRYWTERNLDAVEKYKAIAEKNDMSLIEMAFRFSHSLQGVETVLVGVSSPEQLQTNIEWILKDSLSDQIMIEINEVYRELPLGERFKYYR